MKCVRVIGPLLGLFVVGWVGTAGAQRQVFRPSGATLPEEAVVEGFSLGFQALPGEPSALFEHPLVLTRKLTHASPPLLAALVAEEASETAVLAPVAGAITAAAPPTVTLEAPRLASYTLDLKVPSEPGAVEVRERLALTYGAMSLQDAAPVSVAPIHKVFPSIDTLKIESTTVSKLGAVALSNIVGLSLSFTRDPSDPEQLTFRADAVQITRRAQADSRSPAFATLVRTGAAADELVIVGFSQDVRLLEIRLRGVTFVQYRMAGEGPRATEQIGLTATSFELVTLKDGKNRSGAATVAFAK